MTDVLRRTATHEAAHATIAVRLGLPIGVVSIRRTATYGGVCGFRGISRMPGLDPARPLVLQHARARRYTESLIRCRLAGPVADRMWFPSSGFTRTPRLVSVEARPELPPLAAADLADLEARANAPEAPAIDDEDEAWTEAWLLVGADVQSAYYAWAMADTQAMVSDPLNLRAIERLADELLDRQAMAPHQVRATIRKE